MRKSNLQNKMSNLSQFKKIIEILLPPKVFQSRDFNHVEFLRIYLLVQIVYVIYIFF